MSGFVFRAPSPQEQHTVASVFGTPDRRRRAETATRELIPIGTRGRFANIIVIRFSPGQAPASWGQDMGKRGPKRKEGKREPNGQLHRGSTTERLNQMNADRTKETKSVVLAQPHRRHATNPEDEWLALAAGRFCRAHGLDRVIHEACEAYLNYERRWCSGYGAPKGFENHSGGGSGKGPTPGQMEAWSAQLMKIEDMLRAKPFGRECYSTVRRLIIENQELSSLDDPRMVVSALAEIAVVLGMMNKNPHPFSG